MNQIFTIAFLLSFSFSSFSRQGTSFYYFSKKDRIQATAEMYDALKSRYSLWDIKRIKMKIDGDKIFKNAIKAEENIPDTDSPVLMAKSNLDFHDRMIKTIASFKDTHLEGGQIDPLPIITNGLKLGIAASDKGEKEVIILAYSKKLIELNKSAGHEEQYKKLNLGDRVISIDGVPTEEALEKMKMYTAASSEGFAESRASYYLSRRDFLYPEKNYSDWTFQTTDSEEPKTYSVRFPWYVDKTSRRDVNIYLDAKNFKKLDKTYFLWDSKKQIWQTDKELNYVGYDWNEAPRGIIGHKEWLEGNDVLIRTGYFIKDNKSYGYISFNSFTKNQIIERSSGEKSTLPEVFSKFVQDLKSNKTPLIIDLRTNFGGNPDVAIENLSSIARKDDTYRSITTAYRTTNYIKSFFNSFDYDFSLSKAIPETDNQLIYEEFDHAVSIGREYTNIIVDGKSITADEDVAGYDLPIVALISPWCISSCDVQSLLFKSSGRVTLIGLPSNGTGAGYIYGGAHERGFIDNLYIHKVSIPNFLFGKPLDTDEKVVEVEEDLASLVETNTENRPVIPDVEFHYTSKSYFENDSDWVDKAIEVLNEQITSKKELSNP